MSVPALAEQARRTSRVVPTTELIVRARESDMPVELRAITPVGKAVHSQAVNDDVASAFVTGWTFMAARSQEDQAAISRLLLAATDVLV